MIVAFLFNSDDPQYNGCYGDPIRETIFASGILQASNRHMKVRVGDVLILSSVPTRAKYLDLCEKTYFWNTWKKLKEKKLRATFLKQTIYAWVIQNITPEIANLLDGSLLNDSSYLGMHAVDFAYPVHLGLYRLSMIGVYRIKGKTCNLFFSMGEQDSKNGCEFEELKKLGFDHVNWEDRGAHDTIFDDFGNLKHFEQVKKFKKTVAPYFPGGDDEVEELIMLLEDLNPRLFNTLGAMVRALDSAQNEEDYAHIGLSGRRYLEQLTDTLYPASDIPYKEREVTQDKYKNRLWAYIDSAATSNQREIVKKLGRESYRLFKEANRVLHGSEDRRRVIKMYAELAKFTLELLILNCENARKPYYAFEKNILSFCEQILEKHRQTGGLYKNENANGD